MVIYKTALLPATQTRGVPLDTEPHGGARVVGSIGEWRRRDGSFSII